MIGYHPKAWLTVAALGVAGTAANALSAPGMIRFDPAPREFAQTTCKFDSVQNLPEVAAYGAYEGKLPLPAGIGSSPNEAYVIPIVGPAKGPHRVLLLTSYEAAIWDFSRAPVGRIDAVVVSGFYDQAVVNLPLDIPVHFTSQQNISGCGRIGFYHGDGQEVGQRFQEATGLRVTSLNGSYTVEALRLDAELTPVRASPPKQYRDLRAVVPVVAEEIAPGERGISQLIAQKKLRPATEADVSRWNELAGKKGSTAVRAWHSQNHTFVVLAPMRIPRGMFGANSAVFLIEAGVPDPVDPGSHNSYFRLGDGSCYGSPCLPPPSPETVITNRPSGQK